MSKSEHFQQKHQEILRVKFLLQNFYNVGAVTTTTSLNRDYCARAHGLFIIKIYPLQYYVIYGKNDMDK